MNIYFLIGLNFNKVLYLMYLYRYERLLRRAKTEDLSEVSGIGCLYQSGVDRFGRPVIVFVGKWFRFKEINLDKVKDKLLLFVCEIFFICDIGFLLIHLHIVRVLHFPDDKMKLTLMYDYYMESIHKKNMSENNLS